jgi:ATP-dependent RNA helicase DDX24/MAK5
VIRQVQKHLKAAACFTKIRIMTIVGQMAVEKQERLLSRKPHIVVATPGRLWELVLAGKEHVTNLHLVRQFVLDEADRLTEKNHFDEVHNIIRRLQVEKQ